MLKTRLVWTTGTDVLSIERELGERKNRGGGGGGTNINFVSFKLFSSCPWHLAQFSLC